MVLGIGVTLEADVGMADDAFTAFIGSSRIRIEMELESIAYAKGGKRSKTK